MDCSCRCRLGTSDCKEHRLGAYIFESRREDVNSSSGTQYISQQSPLEMHVQANVRYNLILASLFSGILGIVHHGDLTLFGSPGANTEPQPRTSIASKSHPSKSHVRLAWPIRAQSTYQVTSGGQQIVRVPRTEGRIPSRSQ
ncbi:hypothetical protein BKA70DRAFT_1443206 [Coprinopsis sp. MPI-PUGE-AT-0042]|nr:hypothetical protein BKA70DRAFT_1443206 [Coprinopsis sp. MPI-PUGE-AT-0042]